MTFGSDYMIIGYKCFNKGLINRYGTQFEIGQIYQVKGEISFGNKGNGFHICINLEDTLRYFDGMNEEIDICIVQCFGNTVRRDDEYNGYYDMYSCEYMRIIKKLTREEIIFYGLNLTENRAIRFISLYKLTESEKKLFQEKFQNYQIVLDYIEYYQNNHKDIFKRKLLKNNDIIN